MAMPDVTQSIRAEKVKYSSIVHLVFAIGRAHILRPATIRDKESKINARAIISPGVSAISESLLEFLHNGKQGTC